MKDGIYLDIGCGTGNYLGAMLNKGVHIIGVDPSPVMLQAAKAKNPKARLIQGSSDYFNGAMAVLTIHHWDDIAAGLKELNRVIKSKGRLVFFSFTPEQVKGYWLHHYFPKMIEKAAASIPHFSEMEAMLKQAGFSFARTQSYFVAEGLKDHFLYANKSRPERYLIAEVRNGASGFRLADDQVEIEHGLITLQHDIESGKINDIMSRYASDIGDYLFITAEKMILK